MKKKLSVLLALVTLLSQASGVYAMTSLEAKATWQNTVQARVTMHSTYQQANTNYKKGKNNDTEENAIRAGKDLLNAWLDESEAWLNWKDAQSAENARASDEIKNNIHNDVEANLAKIAALRSEVNSISTMPGFGIMWLKMVGKYVELLTDVARNSGAAWVDVGNKLIDTADGYELKLRTAAMLKNENADIIQKLDTTKSELSSARNELSQADAMYKQVVLPGTPLMKFNSGNGYILQARQRLQTAQAQMLSAFTLIISNQ